MSECPWHAPRDAAQQTPPFEPPWPRPHDRKPGLWARFRLGWHSWVHTLCARAYGMKMGETRLPRLAMFMVNELPLVHRVLDDAEGDFPKHWLLDDLLRPLIGQGVFVANGAEWQRQRAMINPAFVHTNMARAFPVMMAAAQDLVARLKAMDLSRPVDVDPLMTHVAADVIFRTLFSRALTGAEAMVIHRAFTAYQAHAQRATTLGLYGLPRMGFGALARRQAARIRGVFAPIIAARMAARAQGVAHVPPDLLDSLLAARDPKTGQGFDESTLIDQVAVLFLAGHETTASALAWSLYLLAEVPVWQDRLRDEMAQVTGGASLAHGHLRGMEAMRNVFRESLRLYPPVSFLPRVATHAIAIRDKAIVPGDMIVAAPWLVHRNPQHWALPHAFDPDRFTTPQGIESARQAWIPFGRGPRVCVGAGFATQEAQVVLAAVLRTFRLEAARPPDLVSRLTLRPRGGVWLRFAPL
ncbi:cytochrome P450 [Novosphingobium sp. FSY-8]|uniref:Cytochrome P450 n=1 Tax=Novosphingobium ovatum TaxID=1908523 RepID=A0ABW9XCL2_9SPHN|nr:cytochrome P450 [Novosphingobium ovatum]NBC36212.1 cytochrome P450 [Novosphingobium ovatum]